MIIQIKNEKQDKIYLTKDNQILNFNGNTIKSKLNESLLIKNTWTIEYSK